MKTHTAPGQEKGMVHILILEAAVLSVLFRLDETEIHSKPAKKLLLTGSTGNLSHSRFIGIYF